MLDRRMPLHRIPSCTLEGVLLETSVYVLGAIMLLAAPGSFAQDVASQNSSRRLRADTLGAGWTAESLANLEIGMNPGRSVSYRFRADHDGAVRAVRVYFIFRKICDRGCYAAGDGGIIRVEIRDDDGTANHLPARGVLASTFVPDPLAEWNRRVEFPQVAALHAGKLYHIVFSNASEDETRNFVSIDDLYTATDETELQPAANETGLAVLLRRDSASAWALRPHHLPIFSLYFEDGFRQGQGYMDVKQSGVVVSPESNVREVFTVEDATHFVVMAGVRIKPLSSGGKLRILLATDSGQTIEDVTVATPPSLAGAAWTTHPFTPPRALTKGARYSLVLVSEEGGQYLVQPLQNGTQYGFEFESPFTGNHCEVNAGQGWKGCLNRSDLDIPFYFRSAAQRPSPGKRAVE